MIDSVGNCPWVGFFWRENNRASNTEIVGKIADIS